MQQTCPPETFALKPQSVVALAMRRGGMTAWTGRLRSISFPSFFMRIWSVRMVMAVSTRVSACWPTVEIGRTASLEAGVLSNPMMR